jgi:hypothetical protein
MGGALELHANHCAVRIPTLAGAWRGAGQAASCPVVAPSGAPGPRLHRILVVPRCTWWSLVLADAACWELVVEGLRSGPHIRACLLGFFRVYLAFALVLPSAFSAVAAVLLVTSSASNHACPDGRANAALPNARAAAHPADLKLPLRRRQGSSAGTFADTCTASPTTRSDPPLCFARRAEAGTPRRDPHAATSRDGFPQPPSLGSAVRLAAHVTTSSS